MSRPEFLLFLKDVNLSYAHQKSFIFEPQAYKDLKGPITCVEFHSLSSKILLEVASSLVKLTRNMSDTTIDLDAHNNRNRNDETEDLELPDIPLEISNIDIEKNKDDY